MNVSIESFAEVANNPETGQRQDDDMMTPTWASPLPMLLPWAPKAATRSEADRRPSLSVSMMPKASLNCWMAEWEKDSKMLAFLGIL